MLDLESKTEEFIHTKVPNPQSFKKQLRKIKEAENAVANKEPKFSRRAIQHVLRGPRRILNIKHMLKSPALIYRDGLTIATNVFWDIKEQPSTACDIFTGQNILMTEVLFNEPYRIEVSYNNSHNSKEDDISKAGSKRTRHNNMETIRYGITTQQVFDDIRLKKRNKWFHSNIFKGIAPYSPCSDGL